MFEDVPFGFGVGAGSGAFLFRCKIPSGQRLEGVAGTLAVFRLVAAGS